MTGGPVESQQESGMSNPGRTARLPVLEVNLHGGQHVALVLVTGRAILPPMNDPDPVVKELPGAADAARELDCLVSMGTIAGRVAHEINNPLASIQNAFLLVKDAIPASHPHYQYVAAIERQIQRIATVTRSLAETYRPEQDRAVGVGVSTIVADAARLASQTGGVAVQVDNYVQVAFAPPAGLLRHALHQALVLVMQSADRSEPIRVEALVGSDGLSVRVRYHATGAAVAGTEDKYPHRLLAAMGGSIEFLPPRQGWNELALHMPTIARTRGNE
jgi:signal transduction histidine kinase